ncbi:MAG: Ldh family oxidoreductase [Microscillaceae bacterium]|nr:Ldh family oxidoreductase [Microscillaceae bacterium]MDW8461683.1 Ldh family oxidoreductase [Cytophagales bacterium]
MNEPNQETVVSPTVLAAFVQAVFERIGCEATLAHQATQVLIAADLRGIDSHGVARLSGYVKQWEIGNLNPKPKFQILHQTPSTAVLDADRGLGLVAAQEAMRIAIDKAEQVGTGWVAVQNSGHFGIAGYHAMLALPKDMIGWAMTHASNLVAPTFSLERLLGTNPIAIAIPALQEPPFVADFATTAVAYGKLQILQRRNEPAPIGWVQDAEGNSTTDAHALKNGGALLPLGTDREHGSHKGYALAAMVDILSGVLSGANYGPWVPPFATAGITTYRTDSVGKGTGHFLGAMRIDAFRPVRDFKQDMDNWIRTFRNAKAIKGQRVIIPGEPEYEMENKRKKTGIPLLETVVQDLRNLAQKLGIDFKI